MQPSSVKHSCYLGKLPVLGQLDKNVAYKSAAVDCSLVVINCPGLSLCGWDLFFQLSNAGSLVLNLAAEAASPTSLPAVDDIVNEFQDVFSAEIGCISGPPVHLQLKEGATPKFYKARSIPFALHDKVSQELDRLVAIGVLSGVAHAEWATPIVPVLKKDGTVQILRSR